MMKMYNYWVMCKIWRGMNTFYNMTWGMDNREKTCDADTGKHNPRLQGNK